MKQNVSAPDMQVRKIKRQRRLAKARTQLSFLAMMLIPLAFFLLIRYWPMYGLSIAFQNYKIGDPFISKESRWVGLYWFEFLFKSPNFKRMLSNTIVLNLLNLLIAFPISIGFALMLNEIRVKWLRGFTANVSLLPHFISLVVIVAIMYNLFSMDSGLVNTVIEKLGGEKINFMGSSEWFRPLYVGSAVWQNTGFNAVVFTAAIAGIDPNLYEAAALDGSNRLKNIFYITIPCILPTIITMFLLRIGKLMTVGYEKILLMYTPATYEVADVLSTYSYRVGLESQKYSLSAAVSLMNSVVNVILLVAANKVTKKLSDTALW